MRKSFFVLAFFFAMAFNSYGCDICGCSSGGYLGVMPQFRNSFIGLRYSQNSTTFFPTPEMPDALKTAGTSRQADLWGRFYPLKRLEMMAFVPYKYGMLQDEDESMRSNGLGDITLLSHYLVSYTGDSICGGLQHSLQVGGGITAPTGKYNLRDKTGETYPMQIQPGAGQWDAIADAILTLRYEKYGFTSSANYYYSFSHPEDFRLGDRLSLAGHGFYWIKSADYSVLPQAGVVFEHAAKARDGSGYGAYSGGNVLYASVRAGLYLKHWIVGAELLQPVSQSQSQGYIHSGEKAQVYLTYSF